MSCRKNEKWRGSFPMLRSTHPAVVGLVVAMAILSAAWPASAQDAKPAKKPKPAAAKRAPSTSAAKPKAPAASAPAAGAAKSEEAMETVEARPDPAVEAVLESKPSTPGENFRAAKILADLGRPDLAKGFLQKILDAKLDDPQFKELVERFGSAAFTGMAANKDLAPQAGSLTDAALAAVAPGGRAQAWRHWSRGCRIRRPTFVPGR